MDEISRELPPDVTGAPPRSDHTKGPDELVAFERGQVDAELVVRGRLLPPSPEAEREADRAGERRVAVVAMTDSAAAPNPPEPDPAAAAAAPAVVPEVQGATEVPVAVPVGDSVVGDSVVGDSVVDASVVEAPVEAPVAEPVAEPVAAAGIDAPATFAAPIVDLVDAAEAAAAVAAEAEVAAIEEEIELGDDEGLPAVPELTDPAEVAKVVFVLMLTSREGLSVLRLAQAANTTQKLVEAALVLLQQQLRGLGLPVELARTGDAVKWMSGSETFVHLQRLRGVKKLEKLSPAALETLAVIAYRQPVMRSEIEAIRGVKAGPMLRTLLQHKLVRCTGRAEVPGRPLQYGTTPQFLERFGLASLQDLPSVKEWKSLG
jgi:segregation and condensation protein B